MIEQGRKWGEIWANNKAIYAFITLATQSVKEGMYMDRDHNIESR